MQTSSPIVRRVVTTNLVGGRSAIASDEFIPAVPGTPGILDGGLIYQLWGADARPYREKSGAHPVFDPSAFPPGGFRFLVVTVAPMTSQEFDGLPAGHCVHATPTVDLIIVIAGEIWLELDEEAVKLAAGDVAVQNATAHAWHNHASAAATLGVVMLGDARMPVREGSTCR